MPRSGPPAADRREILIALNASLEVKREAVPRLARRWRDWSRPGKPPRKGGAPRVPNADLEAARRVVATAAAVATEETRRAADLGATVVVLGDSDYPRQLDDLAEPPPVLYCLGTLPDRPAVAIVGSRRCDAYGRAAAELFARDLAAAGLVVVSGFAVGIDTVAHRAALASPDGRTVAVLGCGIDVDYPSRSGRLKDAVRVRGAVLSEFPIGCAPQPRNFPIRNRIIAALGAACLVVQAARRSGSLITAHLALELGRDVFAVPGRIFDTRANGTNALIRDGAHPVQHPDELLETLPCRVQESLQRARPTHASTLGGAQGRLLEVTTAGEPRSAEELSTRSRLPLPEVLAILVELEIAGLVVRHPGSTFSRRV